jgi:hypothetical protein
MSTREPDSIQQLLSRVQQVKRSNEPFISKIAEMDHLIDVYASRPPARYSTGGAQFMPSLGKLPMPSAPAQAAPPSPPRPTFASQFGEILMYLDTTTRSFLRTADDIASYLRSSTDLDWSAAVIVLCKAF